MSTADDLERVLDIILVDCYSEDEQYTAFLTQRLAGKPTANRPVTRRNLRTRPLSARPLE